MPPKVRKEKASEKSEPKDVVVVKLGKAREVGQGQEAVCPWESADPGGLSPGSASGLGQSQGTGLRQWAVWSLERWRCIGGKPLAQELVHLTSPAEMCPWEASERRGGQGNHPRRRRNSPRKSRKTPRIIWKEQKLGEGLRSLCRWERTDFRGPSVDFLLRLRTPVAQGVWAVASLKSVHGRRGDLPSARQRSVPGSWVMR